MRYARCSENMIQKLFQQNARIITAIILSAENVKWIIQQIS